MTLREYDQSGRCGRRRRQAPRGIASALLALVNHRTYQAPTAPMLGALAWLGTRKIVDNTRTSGYRESEAGSRVQIVAANGRVGDACCWRPRTGES